MVYHANKYFLRIVGAAALAAAFAISVASCNNNQGGFSGSVGNTPNGPPLTSTVPVTDPKYQAAGAKCRAQLANRFPELARVPTPP